MFGEFFRFDLRFHLRSPLLWIGAFVFALMAYGATCSDSVTIGGGIGNVHRNAPYVIVNFLGVFSILGVFLVTAFIAGGILRDFELGTSELFFVTPMRKADYLFGRFAAGIVVSLLVFVFISAGIVLGSMMPWIDPERLGPTSLRPYAWAMAVVVLPNILFIGATLALLAATTRSLLTVYLGIIGLIVLWGIAGTLTRDVNNDWIASLMDPFGVRAIGRMTRYWSVAERNTQLPAMQAYLLANRALWLAVAAVLLAATYALFKPQRAGTSGWRFWRRRAAPPAPALAPTGAPAFRQRFGRPASATQLLAEVRLHTVGVLRSVPFLVMLAFGMANLVGAAASADELFGTEVYPVTGLMLQAIQSSYTFLLVLIVIFYAGDLIWKERTAGLGEVVDAMPVPDWVPLAAKLCALSAVVLIFLAAGGLTCMGYQLSRGYTHFEPLLYVKGLLLESVPFVLMGGLAIVLQVVTNNRFLGYLLMILSLIAPMVLTAMHFDHHLYDFAGSPNAPYSDMNGYGHFLKGKLWFDAYWSFATALLVVLASALWVRGVAPEWRVRLRQGLARLRGPQGVAAGLLFAAFAGSGCWIFYNTNVRNEYVPGDVALDRKADYEKKYRQYKDIPMPRITDVQADVDIFPEERRAVIRGHYRLVNKHDKPISQIHLTFDPHLKLSRLDFAPAKLVTDDKVLGYRIYELATPMAPGASMDFNFAVEAQGTTFTNGDEATLFHENGTFFNNVQCFPNLGYNDGNQILDRNERRKRGLGPVQRMAKLEDEAARANSAISHEADWINFDTTVSTSADQIALAPGYLQREWTENGRRYFHYKMDVPMLPFFAYLSGRWEVKRDKWKDVAIEVYYDAKHPYNVDRMIDATKKSLDYFTTNFTPYQHHQVRILEFPRYEQFAQSFANTIPFSESIGFIADLRDKDAIDYVFYVTAHEVAHQWWAHQVIGADVQGSDMLAESFAQYSALMVMEKEYGREKMRRFLKYELDRYLRSRGGELVEELPLYRVENQPYIHYSKGSLVMYRLRDEIGEDRVNRALSRYLKDKGYQQPPYTTTKEFLEYLRAETPPDKQSLVTDLFEKIIFYDNRATEAKARKLPDGKYEVELTYEAKKLVADGQGAEKPIPVDDWIDVGVFARKPGEHEADERVLYLEKQHITQSAGTLKIVVNELPYEAGLDPYNKLIDRVPTDNRKTVSVQ